MATAQARGCGQNISRLQPEDYDTDKVKEYQQTKNYSMAEKNWGHYLITFVVVTLVAWLILYFLKPAFLQTRNADGSLTGLSDTGKTLGTSVIIGLLAVLILWFAKRA